MLKYVNVLNEILENPNSFVTTKSFFDVMGDYAGAVFLSRCILHTTMCADSEGWFPKTYKQWKDDVLLSEDEIKKYSKILIEKNLLKTKVIRNGDDVVVHYQFLPLKESLP